MKEFFWEVIIPAVALGLIFAGLTSVYFEDRCSDVPRAPASRGR